MDYFNALANYAPALTSGNPLIIQQALAIINTMQVTGYWNAKSSCPVDGASFDYIIVGGGTSGCVIANRLSEDCTVKVLLIEAGGDFPLESELTSLLVYVKGSQNEWNYKLSNSGLNGYYRNNFITLAGKTLGGTSSIDLMMHSPHFDTDYNEWADITNESSWRFENIQRLIKKVERLQDPLIANSTDKMYHGFHGNVGLVKERSPILDKYFKIFKEAGHKILPDINNGNKLGFSGSTFYRDFMRQNSALAYLCPANNRPNLYVLKHTKVIRVTFGAHMKADGVIAEDVKTKKNYRFKANLEVILTAGTFNTPKILQSSGIGPRNCLQSLNIKQLLDLPVGDNFQNHIFIPAVFALNKTKNLFRSLSFNPYRFPDLGFEGFVALDKSQEYPDYRVFGFLAPYTPPTVMARYASIYYNYDPNVITYWLNNMNGREELIAFVEVAKPTSRGFVRIQSQNHNVPPLIHAEHFTNQKDLKNLVKFFKDFMQVQKSAFFKEIGAYFVDPMKGRCGVYNLDCEKYWTCYVKHLMTPNSHQCGTAAMGSVVDGRLRVIGTEGLRVADASIMPKITSGSITMSTILIGENVSEMIRQDRRSKIVCKKE